LKIYGGLKMSLKKLDMARVIVTALYNLDKLAPENHHAIKRLMKWKKDDLRDRYKVALKVLSQKIK